MAFFSLFPCSILSAFHFISCDVIVADYVSLFVFNFCSKYNSVGIGYLLMWSHVVWCMHNNIRCLLQWGVRACCEVQLALRQLKKAKVIMMVLVFRLFSSCMCRDLLGTCVSCPSSTDEDVSMPTVQHQRLNSVPCWKWTAWNISVHSSRRPQPHWDF